MDQATSSTIQTEIQDAISKRNATRALIHNSFPMPDSPAPPPPQSKSMSPNKSMQ
jgi:hypothetical protein